MTDDYFFLFSFTILIRPSFCSLEWAEESFRLVITNDFYFDFDKF